MKLVVLLSIFLIQNATSDQRADPLVQIGQGLVRGQWAEDNNYSYFLGIPYAKVDHENPFGSSLSPDNFEDEMFVANDMSAACPQPRVSNNPNRIITLDCLNANIYVPTEASFSNPLPVLVWIHGGAFRVGQGGSFDPKFFMKLGIVFVTLNYRVGPYGFMCLDSPLVPGNQGLKDQHEALRWIKDNIAAFGGDPNKVTIAGQSGGASSVLLHLYSHKEKLFHQVIALAGTPVVYGMFVEPDYNAATKLAAHLGFSTNSTDQAIAYLNHESIDNVIAGFVELSLYLRPCKEIFFDDVDNFFVTYPSIVKNDHIKNTPIIIGHNTREEGGQIRGEYFNTDPFYERIKELFILEEAELQNAASIVRNFYIGDVPISTELTAILEDFESDAAPNHGIERTINHLLREGANPVYRYLFTHVQYDTGRTETLHEDELYYLFSGYNGFQNFNGNFTSEESLLVIQHFTTLWANFVKYGNPTPEVTELLPVTWKPVTDDISPYMDIGLELQMKSRVFRDRLAFWDLFYDLYGDQHRLSGVHDTS